jgi:hypothetical protein
MMSHASQKGWNNFLRSAGVDEGGVESGKGGVSAGFVVSGASVSSGEPEGINQPRITPPEKAPANNTSEIIMTRMILPV